MYYAGCSRVGVKKLNFYQYWWNKNEWSYLQDIKWNFRLCGNIGIKGIKLTEVEFFKGHLS